MERSTLDKLKSVYKDQTVQRDVFGRRSPTAREVEQALGIRVDESQFPPTEGDIFIKDQGEKQSVKKRR